MCWGWESVRGAESDPRELQMACCPPARQFKGNEVRDDSIYNELKKITVTSAKIALSCKISSQDTMTDSKVCSDGRIVFYALEIV